MITIALSGTLGMAMLAAVTIRVGTLFGAGPSLDAYLVGVSGPALLLSLAATVMAPALTPRLSVLAARAAARRAGEWATVAFLAGVCMAGTIAVFRGWIVALLAPGLSADSSQLAAHVLAIYALSLPATLAASVYAAFGFANGRVWTSGASSSLYGAAWLSLLFIHPFMGSVTGASVACVIASQVQLVSAFVFSATRERKAWPRLRAPHRPWVALAALSAVALNATLGKANIILDPMLGSLVGRGDVSLLVYATRIVILIVAVCGQGPALMVLGGRRSASRPDNPLAPAAAGVTFLMACGVATAVALVFEPLAVLLLAHGAFTPSAATEVGRIIEAYAPAIVLTTLAWSLEFALYSLGYTWKIVRLNLPGLIVNVGLSIALLPSLGVMARPVAVGVGMLVYVVLLSRCLRRDHDGFDVVTAIPKRATGALVLAVGAVSVSCRFAGNRLFHASVVWAIVALSAAGILAVLAARRWLSQRDPPGALPVDETRDLDVRTVTGTRRPANPRKRHGLAKALRQGFATWAPFAVVLACAALGAAIAVLPHPLYLLLAVFVLVVVLLIAVNSGATGPLALLFASVALVPVVTGSQGTGNPTVSSLRTVLILGLIVLAGVQLPRAGSLPNRLRPAVAGLGAMVLVGAAVTMFTSHGGSDYIREAAQAAGQPLAYVLLLVVLAALLRTNVKARTDLVAAWCIAVVAEGMIVAGQLVTGAAYDPLRGFTRAQGTMGADFLGVFCAMGIFAGAYLRTTTTSVTLRRLGGAAIVGGIFGLIASVSRGALIGLGIAVIWLLLRPAGDAGARRRRFQVAVILLIAGLGLYAGRSLWETRLNSLSTGGFDRPATWISGLRIAEDNLLTGVGPRHVAEVVVNDPRYSQTPYGLTTSNPHNAWLFLADSEGVPYALILVLVTVALVRAVLIGPPTRSRSFLLASLTAGGAVFFINNLFDHPEITLFVVLACVLAVTEAPHALPSRDPSERSSAGTLRPRRRAGNRQRALGIPTATAAVRAARPLH